ncbi:MAG: prolyl oligopeptidase family serine peptidase [Pirellulales bacterium]
MRQAVIVAWMMLVAATACADGPADNIPQNVRRLPKLGVEVPADKRAALEEGLKRLEPVVAELRKKTDPLTRELWPDVAIYHKAVHDALKHQEFHQPKEIDDALKLLQIGLERGDQLLKGQAPWNAATGLVVRGYVSRLDGSVQPYGMVVPASYSEKGAGRHRLDLWFHGRGEVLTEVNFLRDRAANVGTFAPADAFVLHPYGRWNNAFKLAGEVDVLEALESARRRYRIDDDRIAVRGFSMGGAGAWHFAVHYPDRFFAANPGAGFSETPEFLRVFQKETLAPTPWEQSLWNLYDCNRWAANLAHLPTVAYSGEDDSQKQAADVMEAALAKENLRLTHIIGPKTGHSYHPAARDEVERRLASLARRGRDHTPDQLQFVTYTLKYNQLHWVVVDELGRHWEQARVRASFDRAANSIQVQTTNVAALTLQFEPGESPFDPRRPVTVTIDGVAVVGPHPATDRSWTLSMHREGTTWREGVRAAGLRKSHNLQGPIDDAFMDSFLFVHPTGPAWHETTAVWVESEMERAVEHWRRHFRGNARVKEDVQVTDDDLAAHHLILWGDPSSNKILAKIADKLPIEWKQEAIRVGTDSYAGDRHALIAIYPNPLNPKRYVVLNSGFTFRDYAHLNNARQIPVLPDWAIIDLTTPPNPVWPGKVIRADFFNEAWAMP